MPTEVGVSLALRRQHSLINSKQEGTVVANKRNENEKNSHNDVDNDHNDGDHASMDTHGQNQKQQHHHHDGENHELWNEAPTPQHQNGKNGDRPSPFPVVKQQNLHAARSSRSKLPNGTVKSQSRRRRRRNSSSSISSASSSSSKALNERRSSVRPLHQSTVVGLPPSRSTATTNATTTSITENSAWHVLKDGALIYVSCMVLPTVVRWCIMIVHSNRLTQYLLRWGCDRLDWFAANDILQCQNLLLWSEDDMTEYSSADTTATATTTWTDETTSTFLAPDAGLSDFAIVGCLALFLASLRISLIYFLVPKLSEPKRMEALVRCKSIHLLSSSYPGAMTPVKPPSSRIVLSDLRRLPDLPDLSAAEISTEEKMDHVPEAATTTTTTTTTVETSLRPNIDQAEFDKRSTILGLNESFRRKMDHDWFSGDTDTDQMESKEGDDDDDNEYTSQAPLVQTGLLSRSSAQNLQAVLEQATIHRHQGRSSSGRMSRRNSASSRHYDDDTDNNNGHGGRVYAAPKYATAIFRLIFSVMSAMIAYMSFVDAEFWPPILLGNGSTLNCWSLSSVGLAMDSDFDQYNTALRRYYLIQASYHVHSAAFHVFTSILLWFVSKSSSRNTSQSGDDDVIDRPSWSVFRLYNIHTFFRHCFSIGLILVTYLFSSTRRLGVIAMFALDLSNIPLHVLQIRINAPMKGIQGDHGTRETISLRMLHFLVMVSFCFLRVYVCVFVIAFSALEESQSSGWMDQLNSMQSGVASAMKGFFVIGFLVYLMITAVYFFRLLTHSHVRQAVDAQATKLRA